MGAKFLVQSGGILRFTAAVLEVKLAGADCKFKRESVTTTW